ncbi:MAG TPA: hypothetical protein VGP41_05165 [Candidatus Lustribacter sp.]|nr:hypothetical protein [Candidatus Lustribacter sp.]
MSSPDLSALDPEQRSDVLSVPLERRKLTGPLVSFLWFLRVYVVLSVAVVIVAFAHALR